MRRFVALVTGLALAGSPAWAGKGDDDDEYLEGKVQRKEGEYGGVWPGHPPRAHEGKNIKPPKAGTLAWVGFQQGTIFLQAGSAIAYTQHVEGKQLVVHLTGVKRFGRQVGRALDTRFFDTPISRVTVKKVKKRKAKKGVPARAAGVEVRISFKDPATVAEASIRSNIEADGLFYMYISLGGGGDMPAMPEETPDRDGLPDDVE
jgi:hypothetical protein